MGDGSKLFTWPMVSICMSRAITHENCFILHIAWCYVLNCDHDDRALARWATWLIWTNCCSTTHYYVITLTANCASTTLNKNKLITALKVCWTVHVYLKARLCDEYRARSKYIDTLSMRLHVAFLKSNSASELLSIMHTLTAMQFASKKLFQQ